MTITYITNAGAHSGVGHRAQEIAKRLASQVALDHWHIDGDQGQLLHNDAIAANIHPWPGRLGRKSINWLRLAHKISDPGVVSLTNQTLSFLAKKFHPSIVTVHDLVELIEPQQKNSYWLNKYLYSGITKADHIIAVSQYTAQTIQDYYHIPVAKITVIHNGVGPEFHPIPNFQQSIAYQTLRQELKLPAEAKMVLYVGSDHPRKNATGAVQAFTKFLAKQPNAMFLKVGEPGLASGRAALLAAIDQLAIRDQVRFVGNASLERLNELYNLADVLIYPSLYEGFGLPPLQAMAAGTPVLTSNATSLPEVVGEAALTHDPNDIDAFADSLERVINDQALRRRLIAASLARVQQFSWEKSANKELNIYKQYTTS